MPMDVRKIITGIGRRSSERIPTWFTKGLHSNVDHARAWRGYRQQAMRGNDESLLMWPIRAAAEKIVGGKKGMKKIRGGIWRYMSVPAMRLDTTLGRGLSKIPVVGKSLFTVKEDIPWGKGLKREVTRTSATAPLAKARDIAEPILVGVGLEKGIKALSKKPQVDNDQGLREKVASVMLHLHEKNKEHEKRAHALKVLFKQAELGYGALPQSFSELETKLAALVTEDLCVLDKALDLAGSNVKLGEISTDDPRLALSPVEKFQATILGDELLTFLGGRDGSCSL